MIGKEKKKKDRVRHPLRTNMQHTKLNSSTLNLKCIHCVVRCCERVCICHPRIITLHLFDYRVYWSHDMTLVRSANVRDPAYRSLSAFLRSVAELTGWPEFMKKCKGCRLFQVSFIE